MTQADFRLEEEVRELSPDVGGDYRDSAGTAVRPDPGQAPWSGHAVNLRLSLPFLFGRYYVTLVAGRERRHPDRRKEERRKHPIWALGNLAAIFGFGCIAGLALLALVQLASAYVLQQFGIMVAPQ